MINNKKNSGFLGSIADIFGNKKVLQTEKARLEAFLSAVPGEYCGWSSDGSVIYSHGFCKLLGINNIENIIDIQNTLTPEDSSALESLFNRLKTNKLPFTINIKNISKTKTFKLSGTIGKDLCNTDIFYILWLEDITEKELENKIFEEEHSKLHNDMEKLQEALDALPHPIWIRDKEQKIIWCNVAYAKTVDAPPSEIVAQQKEIISPHRKRKPSEKNMLFGADLARAALKKSCTQTIKTHEVLGGNRHLLKISEIPLIAKNMSVGIAEDLTEEEKILDEIKNNNSANRALLEQLRSAIAIYDADHRLEFYNSSFAQLWGLEDGWLNKKPKLGDIMEKLRETRRLPEQADFKAFKKSWLDMFTRLIEPHEDMLYLPDGSALRMLVVAHKIGGLMMTFEDVTSRLALESSYNTLVAVQKETLDNLEEGVAVYGGDGRLKLWNPAFGKLWSIAPESLEGEPHISHVVNKMAPSFDKKKWEETKETLISIALDRSTNKGWLKCINGTLIDYSTVALPDGGVLITYTDVTDTVRVEKALRDKNAALEAAERLKLDFLANVSYQLRTPLNVIMGFNEMLDKEFFGPLNEKQKEYTRDIGKASQQLLNLVNDILDLSTIEAGQMDLDIEKISIKEIMQNIMDLVRDWARKKKIEISLSCPDNIGYAEADSRRLKQAIINVIRNSITYTDEKGNINLIVSDNNRNIKITIQDNGIGIPKSEQKRILQPFERIEGKQQGVRGAGLGLTLVQNIIKLHGGKFSLSSKVDKGTTVNLTIPKKYKKK